MHPNRLVGIGVLVFLLLLGIGSAADLWETDFEKAGEIARKTNRYMLLDFSGSDWCGWCMRLESEVFSKAAFKKYAEENLVCVLLDFPRSKTIKKALREQNERLMAKYGVRGFPTIIILSPTGDLVGQTGYQPGGAEKYVEHLKGFIDPHRNKHNIPAPVSLQAETPQKTTLHLQPHSALLPRDETRETREWKAKSGATIKARLLEEKGAFIVLRQEDGTEVQIQKERLSEEDQKYIADLREKTLAPSPAVPTH